MPAARKAQANRAKSRTKVAKIHAKIRDDRQDFTRKIAVRMARENQTVAIETLNIKALARTRLAKSIHDAGWGGFINDLTHAGRKYGATIIGISQWEPTSQKCSVCGIKDGKKPWVSGLGPARTAALGWTGTTTQH